MAKFNEWQPGDLPKSIDQYGLGHSIWSDLDLIKYASIAFVVGVIVGWVL